MAATGSVLTNKYSEGYPGKRYYGGNRVIDEAEDLARRRACDLFGAEHANVQPHAGANANLAAYLAVLEHGRHRPRHAPGSGRASDPRLTGQRQRAGSTASSPTGSPRATSAWTSSSWPPSPIEHRPKLIVAGATAYPADHRPGADPPHRRRGRRPVPLRRRPRGRAHRRRRPSQPVGVADIVTFTTHKTLRGPRGGAILCTEPLASAIDKAVFPGLQGGPLEHVIAAKAVAFREASPAGVPGVRRPDRPQRPGAGGGPGRPRGSASCPGAPTTISCWSTCGPSTPS